MKVPNKAADTDTCAFLLECIKVNLYDKLLPFFKLDLSCDEVNGRILCAKHCIRGLRAFQTLLLPKFFGCSDGGRVRLETAIKCAFSKLKSNGQEYVLVGYKDEVLRKIMHTCNLCIIYS